jgi:hypothetical protein
VRPGPVECCFIFATASRSALRHIRVASKQKLQDRVSPNLSAGPKPAARIVIAFSCFALYMAHSDSF